MKPTLLVLAAGMGSRYGGLKQIDPLGPNGQIIIEYSIYDAIRAGFGKVVFVIRKDIEKDFKEIISSRVEGKIEIDYVFQEKNILPAGFEVPADRVKPWGTAHAVLVAYNAIKEPFAVINADDFYGAEAYETMAIYLKSLPENSNNKYCMVGYPVVNTLSDHGSVSRGVCEVDANNNLVKVVERTKIERIDGEIVFIDENEQKHQIAEQTPVSMNLWGFTPSIFDYLWKKFEIFLKENIENPKSEFLIPWVVDELIKSKLVETKVLTCNAKSFGVTYKEDRPIVVEKINKLTQDEIYPPVF